MTISTSVWSAQHPNASRNIQQVLPLTMFYYPQKMLNLPFLGLCSKNENNKSLKVKSSFKLCSDLPSKLTTTTQSPEIQMLLCDNFSTNYFTMMKHFLSFNFLIDLCLLMCTLNTTTFKHTWQLKPNILISTFTPPPLPLLSCTQTSV